ncbi:hypothetical protein EV189_3182 [Motilibacter rhizosphaerae]|uniref:Uncharacterized protein n=1 Tax=Motilibacter rhizosphaerae TaxID=598652 RepID=A0A4Q7NFU1_9ACTN|nr:hypothetical protein [Motilibacter rhizosphaerae]RZS82787.1 hypothetical protein EV189_3182 [Motilibacter rhizosphaerae]
MATEEGRQQAQHAGDGGLLPRPRVLDQRYPEHLFPSGPRRRPGLRALAIAVPVVVLVVLAAVAAVAVPLLRREHGRPAARPAVVSAAPPAASAAPATPAAPGPAPGPAPADAAALRSALQLDLTQRLVLTDRLVEARLGRDPDAAAAATQALAGVTAAVQRDVAGVLPAGDAASLVQLWAAAAPAAVREALALAGGDTATAEAAAAATGDAAREAGRLLGLATDGRLQPAAAQALTAYDGAVRGWGTAWADGHYGSAYEQEQRGLESAAALARQVAAAARAASRVPGSPASPALELRLRLQQRLVVHAALLSDAMQASAASGPDAAAARTALSASAADLGAAVGSRLGATAGRGFASAWSDQADAAVAYVTAGPTGGAQDVAASALAASAAEVGRVLATATGGRLAPATVVPSVEAHDRLLLQEAAQWATGDTAAARASGGADALELLSLGRQLASSITAAAGSAAR